MKSKLLSFTLLLLLSAKSFAQIPSIYTHLHGQLDTNLIHFNDTINSIWNGSPSPVTYAGQLTAANCNNGSALLSPQSMPNIKTQLLLLKAIGVKAVSVEVSFPMLYAPFLESVQTGYQNQFLNFYTALADTIRAEGFQLIVECQAMNTGVEDIQGNWPTLPTFYSGLNTLQYIVARSATAAVVASAMKPDYIILQEEPRTEQNNTGQFLDTVTISTRMLDSSLAAVRALAIPGMKVGAGFGTWLEDYQRFANSFTQTACGGSQPCINTPLDFLDIHVFPITENAIDYSPGRPYPPGANNFQINTLNTLAIAAAANIPVTISQAWLRKVRSDEWQIMTDLPYSAGNVQEAREAYNFWASEDQSFLTALYDLANYQGMSFIAPFNTQSWSAYLNWNNANSIQGDCGNDTAGSCGSISPLTVFSDVQTLARNINVPKAIYSSTGQFYHDLIIHYDTIAPTTPNGIVITQNSNQTVDTLKWNLSSDNVGVAGYHVWRDSVALPDIFQSPLIDSGLTVGHIYCYQLQAFDLSGNVSTMTSCNFTGISDQPFTDVEINIYPNPASTQLTITFNQPVQDIEIDNAIGQQILELKPANSSGGNETVDMQNFSTGIYFIKLKSPLGYVVRKVIKE